MRYMIWNNKGGVGKTFLTYTLASEYAIKHPEKKVAVVDMCPQANVSEMLLGGNGTGEQNLASIAQSGFTIAGYIRERYAKSRSRPLGTELGYFVPVSSHNASMPNNLYLLSGDVDLDICSQLIAYMGSAPVKGAWKASRLILDDIIGSFENAHEDTTVFIDCNPSFAVYTEMVAVSARELIVPCTADNASIRGFLNAFRLLYGINAYSLFGGTQDFDDTIFTFSETAKSNGLVCPKVKMIVLNKSRSLDASATKAWIAHSGQIRQVMQTVKAKYPDLFVDSSAENDVLDVKDGNTLATIANHSGLPISKMTQKSYDVYGVATMANQSQIDALMNQLEVVVDRL